MIFSPPLLPYCGLTIILSKPSRIDQQANQLLSGYPGQLIDRSLTPFTRFNCDLRVLEDTRPLLPETKVVLLMGDQAKKLATPELSLNEARGYCYVKNNITYISTYELQDSFDRKKYVDKSSESVETDDEEEIDEGTGKDHSKTRRKNFRFWLIQDIIKSVDILRNGLHPKIQGCKYHIYPNLEEVCQLLNNNQEDEYFYIDIETDKNFQLTCVGFSFNLVNIWVVPIRLFSGELAYAKERIIKFLVSISSVFKRKCVVIHNSKFDLCILAWRYKIVPPKRINDTMLMHHRLHCEAEKSLGHAMSWATHEEFHKNEGIFEPKNVEQDRKLWTYNAKDIAGMIIVHQRLLEEGKKAGILSSYDRANKMVRPYLLQNLMGIKINEEFRKETLEELERLKVQYLRIINILIGYDIEKISPKSVSNYLYKYKDFPKPKPKYLADGTIKYEDLTAAHTLYKLAIKFNIPFLRALFIYRSAGKDAGFLKFDSWTSLHNQYIRVASRDRFTSDEKIAGTDTYRLASTKFFGSKKKYEGTLDFTGWGSNKQNIKKKLRKVYVADGNEIY